MAKLRVKEVAESKGFTAARLARRADLAYGTVKTIWDDPDRDVTIGTLAKIAAVLGVSVKDLIVNGESGESPGNSRPILFAT